MLKTIIRYTFGILVFILIVDPSDLIFHLKIPLFLFLFLTWGILKIFHPIKFNRDVLTMVFTVLLIPILGIIVAVVQNNLAEPAFAMGIIKSFGILLLLIIIMDIKVPINAHLIKFSFIIPCIIIPVYLLSILNQSIFFSIYEFLSNKDVAKFAHRNFYGLDVVMFYYRTSPLLVFPLAYYCNKFIIFNQNSFSALILIILFFFTLILSGTRANMLSGILIILFFLFKYLSKLKSKLPFIVACFTVAYGISIFLSSLSFSKKEASSEIKLGHYESYISLFNEYPIYTIWGQGLGSTFYSIGNNEYVQQTELTYFELIRWFGVPLTLILIFILLYPIFYMHINKRLNKHNKYLIIAYLSYLFIAGTNPLLVSSTGMLVIMVMYSQLGLHKLKTNIVIKNVFA